MKYDFSENVCPISFTTSNFLIKSFVKPIYKFFWNVLYVVK